MARTASAQIFRRLPAQGWTGLLLIAVFWPLNWLLPGVRTHVLFFRFGWAMFLPWTAWCFSARAHHCSRAAGRALLDCFWSRPRPGGCSNAKRSRPELALCGPRTVYFPEYFVLASLSFSTVIPAVFGTAELVSTCLPRVHGPVIRPTQRTLVAFFFAGWVMLALLLLWPRYFFPFMWLSVYSSLNPSTPRLACRRWRNGQKKATGLPSPRYG